MSAQHRSTAAHGAHRVDGAPSSAPKLWPPRSRPILAASLLAADPLRLGAAIEQVRDGGIDWLHLDVMDGHFVPNLSFGVHVAQALGTQALPVDVHLMVQAPEQHIPGFCAAGAAHVTVHAEGAVHLHRLLGQIRAAGARAGVSINPATPVHVLDEVLHMVDLVLVMSVNPGFGGQRFVPEVLSKVRQLAALRAERGHSFVIEIDGGIDESTIGAAAKAGCDAFVAGTAIFAAAQPGQAIATLRQAARAP